MRGRLRIRLVCAGLLAGVATSTVAEEPHSATRSAEEPRAGLECPPVAGAELLLGAGRVVVVGEIHGTREVPEVAGDLVCHALRSKLKVVVGFELTDSFRTDLDAFLGSSGSDADRSALISGSVWQRSYQDGRTSRAVAAWIAETEADAT